MSSTNWKSLAEGKQRSLAEGKSKVKSKVKSSIPKNQIQ